MGKATKYNPSFRLKGRRLLSGCLILVGIALSLAACGKDGAQESGRGEQAQGASANLDSESGAAPESEADAPFGTDAEDGPIAVADFSYMLLDTYDLNDSITQPLYTIDGEWLYYSREVNTQAEGIFPLNWCVYISRGRIHDGWQEEEYIVQTKNMAHVRLHALLADGQGNCYVYWGPSGATEEEDMFYTLEKYDSEGELLWKADYMPEELQDMGDALEQGTVTADGRVFLYSTGKEGRVFSFGPDGSLGEAYSFPGLESLEGVVSGKDGKVYGYCLTGEAPAFVELGGSGEAYPCPSGILEVYDGRGSSPWVRRGGCTWDYDPETGELERLWGWEDEYIQIVEDNVDAVFRDGEDFMVMCSEYRDAYSGWNMDRRPMQTFAEISIEDRGEHSPKQHITLGTLNTDRGGGKFSKLGLVVRMFNRQSREYTVEFVDESSEDSMQMKFIKGEGTDIIDLSYIYAGNLAGIGAFENLTSYYEASDVVGEEDILDSVREACVLAGKNVLVMPSFRIHTLFSLEEEVTSQGWDIWDFLERAEDEWVISGQEPMEALMYCMGIKCGESFIDYEDKECSFDSPEFRRILEACGRVQTYEGATMDNNNHSSFVRVLIDNPWRMTDTPLMIDEKGVHEERFVGYPGMERSEHKLYPDSVFAMNSASEHKDGAWDFLEFLMSEEVQSLISWGFPSRKDVFERSLSDIYVCPTRAYSFPLYDENGKILIDGYPKEVTAHEIELLKDMAANAKYDSWGSSVSPLWNIVADEAGMYFKGDADLDSTVSKIQTRVQLYLDESK
nr:hypothetical protein [uncultured Acetatifactor sp.]